tara:strand:- start:525 stop:695 length:171 start_codon:yes stop_codon:yes gene_type:complete
MIDEIEGILILLGKTADAVMLDAFNALPVEEVAAYRDSIAQEWEILNPGKHMLTID